MSDEFRYCFRFSCDPDFNGERELEAMERYADAARIDDVIVFANSQEINTGHMTFAEQDRWLSYMRDVKRVMEPKGITVSVNHWSSLMHADLGRTTREGQENFRPMVDVAGNTSEICVCPLDGEWRAYYTELFRRYAAEHPTTIWVEDDFRLHNHAPLVWGGCFCEEHMRRYSERAGKPLTREEFVAGVLAPGGVHPYRKIWLDVARETMVETARLIGEAVHAVSPDTRVGLMSSAPSIHAAEGRDWYGVLLGLAGPDNPPVDRIHLPGYVEPTPSTYLMNFNAVSMLTRAMIPPETEIYPELENYPFSRFTKSRRFTRFQLLSALPLNLAGTTIDLYDLSGAGIVWEEGYQDTLRETKGFLNEVTKTGVFRHPLAGVRVMVSETSSYTLHTHTGERMEELYPSETLFASLLPAYGIPFAYCTDPSIEGQMVAVSGQYFRNLDASQLRHLFAHNFVLMNGDALETLYDLGLGELAGVNSLRWMKQDGGEFSFEQAVNGKEYCGLPEARASCLLLASDALAVDYGRDAKPVTAFCNCFRKRTAPALTLAKQGVLVFPFGHVKAETELPHLYLNNVRQAVFQDVLRDVPGRAPFFVGAPYLNPYFVEEPDGFSLYVVNGSTDDCGQLQLDVGSRTIARVEVLESRGGGRHPVKLSQAGEILTLDIPLPTMEAALFRFYQ